MSTVFPVDKVFALCCTKYPEREPALLKELNRVGVLEKTLVVHTFENPFDDVFIPAVDHVSKIDRAPAFFNLTMGHYGILKTALALNIEKILVVEDDCRFIKDFGHLRDSLARAPKDWDALILDAFLWKGNNTAGWQSCGFWRSAAALCMRKSFLQKMVACIERCLDKTTKAHSTRCEA